MRVTTAFNRLLRLPGASVIDVCLGGEGVTVVVRLRRRRRVCSSCGQLGTRIHARRVKRWRHLDLGATRCVIECELRRLDCPDCGVRYEAVPWARAGSGYTRDFEDVVAWLAQQMAKKPIAGMLQIAWDSVGRIVARVVADRLDESRLAGLVAIGCDEISYRRGQRYLTSVVDHATGAIIWCSAGRNAATLQRFFDELGERRHSIRAVSIDMSGGYEKAIRENAPQAEVCFDPFHVVRLGQRAVDQVRRDEWNAHDRSHTPKGKWIKGTRWSLLKSPDKQSIPQLALLGEVQQANKPMFRAFLLKEELRLLYALEDRTLAPAHLDAWLAWASRSRLQPFIKLARTIRRHRVGILAAIRLGPSNARLEGLNSRIRLISHRSFGFHSAAPLIALVYLCCSKIVIDLPR
ncbi:MAG: ISL3 family transposase [Actinobacteria bacterium]|nr:ISL3 family transposase [Actinomycetota bacterium]MCA1700873.1 ISL3 family transposase [Actinomycetota bacterium]